MREVSDPAFSNEPIDVAGLPQLSDDDFSPMHPSFVRIFLLGHTAFAVFVFVVGTLAMALVRSNRWTPALITTVMLILTALSARLAVLRVGHAGYQVREHDLSHRTGVLTKSVQTIPFVRVQHARVTQGPIERAFGLATLAVSSAGPDLGITGLGVDAAERLRALVVARAGELVEES